jgi:transposase, IS30 family
MPRWQRRFGAEDHKRVIAAARRGLSRRQICDEVGWSEGTVAAVLRPYGGVLRTTYSPSADRVRPRLSIDARIRIQDLLGEGMSFREIARRLGRPPSTISREVAVNGGRAGYAAAVAHERARRLGARPKTAKLVACPKLQQRVSQDLERFWSPEQISQRLKIDFADDAVMRVSAETIYQSLFVQGRGALRKELTACLRTGRAQRVPKARLERRGQIKGAVSISERPAEVEDRAVEGHWEGDLLQGAGNKSAVATLVERTTRFVMLCRLEGDHRAETVRDALVAKIAELPDALRRSLTWDRGHEMARHADIAVAADIDIYFCDPHSPWQRGSNENTNGLLRQFLPKGEDLSGYSQDDLDRIADLLNSRPRETLNWRTPAEALDALFVASTP